MPGPTVRDPDASGSSPSRAFSSVVLPEPLRPRIAIGDRAPHPCHHVAASPCRRELETQLPRGPRLLDALEPAELLGGGLLDVLRLLLLAALAVATVLPLPHAASLLLEAPALGLVPGVGLLVPRSPRLALCGVVAPAAGVDARPPRLGLELDHRRHPLEEGPVVRDRHDSAAVRVDEALEQLERGEVEVVGRLVEQEHVGVRGQDRLQPTA
jgi:hypothetical protein